MTPGVILIGDTPYTVSPDGWSGGPEADVLNQLYPLPTGVPGSPMCRAFWSAVRQLGNVVKVIQEPIPAPFPPDYRKDGEQ